MISSHNIKLYYISCSILNLSLDDNIKVMFYVFVSPLPHHVGRGVAVGVHVDDCQGAVRGGAGPKDGVGDQVVTAQGHRDTLVRDDRPEIRNMTRIQKMEQVILLILFSDTVTSRLDIIETCNHISDISNLKLDALQYALTRQGKINSFLAST